MSMNSLLQKLVVGQGCTTDDNNAQATAHNPVSGLVDQVWRHSQNGTAADPSYHAHAGAQQPPPSSTEAVVWHEESPHNQQQHPDMFAPVDTIQAMRMAEQQQQQHKSASSHQQQIDHWQYQQQKMQQAMHMAHEERKMPQNQISHAQPSTFGALQNAWVEAQIQARDMTKYQQLQQQPQAHQEAIQYRFQWPQGMHTQMAMNSHMSAYPPMAHSPVQQMATRPTEPVTDQQSHQTSRDEERDLELEYERNLEVALGSQRANLSSANTSQGAEDVPRRRQAAELAERLRQDPDERFANSELTDFLSKIALGYLQFDDEKGEVVNNREAAPEGQQTTQDRTSEQHSASRAAGTQQSPMSSSNPLEALWKQALEENDNQKIQEVIHSMAEAAGREAATGEEILDSDNMSSEMQEELMKAWAEISSAEIDDWGDILSPPELAAHTGLSQKNSVDTSAPAVYEFNYTETIPASAPNQAEEYFQQGLGHLHNHEPMEAIRAFETAVRLDNTHSEAWLRLGQVHADNDSDQAAITCLHNAVHHDPFNLEARLALGVSYLNEYNYAGALQNLKAWAQHNPTFVGMDQELVNDSAVEDTNHMGENVTEDLMALMDSALQVAPGDPEALIVQGLLYTLRKEYHTASQKFKEALRASPSDYSLWNKFGATLTRSGRSREALPVYQRALQLNPAYVRAQLNIGISHYNLANYQDAVTSYLKALSTNPDAKHLWSHVRLCLTCLERYDLVAKTEAEDINTLRQEFGI